MRIKWLVENLLGCSVLHLARWRDSSYGWLRPRLGVVSDGAGRSATATTFFRTTTPLRVPWERPLFSNSGLISCTLRGLYLSSGLVGRDHSAKGSWGRSFVSLFEETLILWTIADVVIFTLNFLSLLGASLAHHISVLSEIIHFLECLLTERPILSLLCNQVVFFLSTGIACASSPAFVLIFFRGNFLYSEFPLHTLFTLLKVLESVGRTLVFGAFSWGWVRFFGCSPAWLVWTLGGGALALISRLRPDFVPLINSFSTAGVVRMSHILTVCVSFSELV